MELRKAPVSGAAKHGRSGMVRFFRVGLGAAGLSLLLTGSAHGALIVKTHDFLPPPPQNDCSGVFGGTGGTVCDVGFQLGTPISPIVAKFDTNDSGGGAWTTYPGFPTITGAEFTGDFLTSNAASGSWTYTPGPGDPVIRYWVAKGSDMFRLFWVIDDATVGGACGTTYSVSCLQAAQGVTSGSYSTPTGAGLSHISFYDTGGPPTGGDVPEPAALALLGVSLLGAGLARRRQ